MKLKVLCRAPFLSQSGYGINARFVTRALREYEHLFDIYLIPINWGKTSWILNDTEETRWMDALTQKTVQYVNNGGQFDLSLQVTIPGEFERIAGRNIGITAGVESSKISPEWMQRCNEMVDKIVTTSNHASYGFLNTRYYMQHPDGTKSPVKVEKPVEHVTYPVDSDMMDTTKDDFSKFDFPNDFNFLVMAQWSPRKHLENTIKWWVEEFYDKEVGLVVKTSIANGSLIDREHTAERLENLLCDYKGRKCKVHLLHGDLERHELATLFRHPKIKCLISLGNEGFNLPAFEASYCAKLPVLAVNWSGHLDFLYKQTDSEPKCLFTPVDFDIAQVQPEAVWNTVIQADSYWAYPKQHDYKIKLRDVHNNWDSKKEMAEELGEWLCEEFEEKRQYRRLIEAFDLGLDLDKSEPLVLEFD